MLRLLLSFLVFALLSACSGGGSSSDSCPNYDTDCDGIPNDTDDFPYDFDNDEEPDATDAFPKDPTEQKDSDGDGVGDNADAYPYDPEKSKFNISGSLTGAKGEVNIYLNDQSQTLTENGSFNFEVANNISFTITANNLTETQLCHVTNATHTATDNIQGILIECVDRVPLSEVLTSTLMTDSNFLSCLTNLDGIESKLYVDQLTSITCKDPAITSIEGVKNLTALAELILDLSRITEIDVSANTELTLLSAHSNIVLNSVDISGNKKLVSVVLNGNNITQLNLAENQSIEILKLNDNPVTTIDLSANAMLVELNLSDTDLTTINLAFNLELTKLTLDDSSVGSLGPLNLSQNTKLTRLFLNDCQLSELDVSHNLNLTRLDAEDNQMISAPLGLSGILNDEVFINLSRNSFDNIAQAELNLLQETYLNLTY